LIINVVHRLKNSEPEPSEPRLQKLVELSLEPMDIIIDYIGKNFYFFFIGLKFLNTIIEII
jgi:hypothetical protein